jgi:tetratricopeptide (TPR) repeat protein
MDSLAGVCNSQERYDEAESLLTQVLQTRETPLGPKNFDTLNAKHFGPQHPDTLTAKHSLALVFTSQGRHTDAENLLVHVLAARERVLGISHPHTRNTINSLAEVYENLGRLDESMTLKQRISPSTS